MFWFLLLVSIVIGLLRIIGEKGDIFKDIAHFWVAGLFAAGYMQFKYTAKNPDYLKDKIAALNKIRMAITLSIIEVICAIPAIWHRLTVGVVLLCFPFVCHAQLTVPDLVPPYEPIIVGCNCIVPENGVAQFMWRTDQLSKYREVENGTKLHVWAAPGPHYAEAIVIVRTFAEFTIQVADPKDPTKMILQKMKLPTSFNIQRYDKNYTVGTIPVPPGPGPNPPGPNPPGPTPSDPFVAEILKAIQATPTYDSAKMKMIADTYDGVAGAAVATTSVPNLDAFNILTKAAISEKIGVATVAAWSESFFKPMGVLLSQEFAKRALKVNDVPGIAKLWRDYAAAVRAAMTIKGNVKGDVRGAATKEAELREAMLNKDIEAVKASILKVMSRR